MYYQSYYESPIGRILLVSDEENLVGLWLEGQKYFLDTVPEEPILNDEITILVKSKQWLDRYFHLEKPSIKELSLAPHRERI